MCLQKEGVLLLQDCSSSSGPQTGGSGGDEHIKRTLAIEGVLWVQLRTWGHRRVRRDWASKPPPPPGWTQHPLPFITNGICWAPEGTCRSLPGWGSSVPQMLQEPLFLIPHPVDVDVSNISVPKTGFFLPVSHTLPSSWRNTRPQAKEQARTCSSLPR